MGKKILFVEDEPEQHSSLIEKLVDMGYIVDTAPNTLDAYSVLVYDQNRLNYDLVLLDLMMPSGFLGKEYPDSDEFGGICMLKEIKKNNIEVDILVYTHIKDSTIEKLIEDQRIKVVYKSPATAMSDGLDEIVTEVKKILPLE
ncbi:MAG: response regulator [Desulfobacterales bacterium]|nr:response regulator [Desulfobacterales bacterium]